MMKTKIRRLGSLLLAALVFAAVLPAAFAQQIGEDAYIVTGYRYASNESGYVALYNAEGSLIGRVANGARLTVTNGVEEGRTYVHFGAVSGWVVTEDLSEEPPAAGGATGEVAQPNTLTPVVTDPPAEEAGDSTVTGGSEGGDDADGAEDTDGADSAVDAEDDTEAEETEGDTAAEDTEADAEGAENTAGSDDANDTDGAAGEAEAPDSETDTAPDATAEPDEEETGSEKGSKEENAAPFAAMRELPDGGSENVLVARVGVVTCLIETDEGMLEVPTAELTFGDDPTDERKVGYLHAPRTGQAGLRAEPSKEAKVITQLKAGQLVAVLEIGDEYARVNADGQEGWLRLDCLRYLRITGKGIVSATGKDMETAPDGEKAQPEEDGAAEVLIVAEGQKNPDRPASGILTRGEEADGNESVNLRNAPDRNSAKAAVLPTGTEVTVLSTGGGWALVEADGLCAYVMENFVKIAE